LGNTTDATEKEMPEERCTETGDRNDLTATAEEFHSGQSQGEGCSKNRYPKS